MNRVWIATALFAGLFVSGARAQDNYPVKPVRFLVGFPPGGANDVLARALANRLAPRLGQQMVVDNRAGAGGDIATALGAKAPPDGYTILLASMASFAVSPAMRRELGFDPLADFAPVARVAGVGSLIAVHPSLPARSVKELVALARKGTRITYGTPGPGSISHMSAELFLHTAGVKLTHVPYKGGANALVDAISGQIDAAVTLIPTLAPQVKVGKLRAIAFTGAARSPLLPEVPTVAEAGYRGFEASGWLGVVLPAKAPAAVVQRLHREIEGAMEAAELRKQLQDAGLDPALLGPEPFRAYIAAEHAKWGKLIREAGIKAE